MGAFDVGELTKRRRELSDLPLEQLGLVLHSSEQVVEGIDAMQKRTAESLRKMEEANVNGGKSFTKMAEDAAAAARDIVPIIAEIRQKAIDAFGTGE